MSVIRWHAIESAGVIREPIEHAGNVKDNQPEACSDLSQGTETQNLIHPLIAARQIGHSMHRSDAVAVDYKGAPSGGWAKEHACVRYCARLPHGRTGVAFDCVGPCAGGELLRDWADHTPTCQGSVSVHVDGG